MAQVCAPPAVTWTKPWLYSQPSDTGAHAPARHTPSAHAEPSGAGSQDNRMNGPRHIATDTDDRLYGADSGNDRVLIFNRAPVAGAEPRPAVTLTLTTSFIGAGQPGQRLTARATRSGGGKSVFFADCTVTDESGRVIGTGQGTFKHIAPRG